MSDFKENIEKLNIRGIIMSSVMTAFGLVVALSWKDAINELVNSIIDFISIKVRTFFLSETLIISSKIEEINLLFSLFEEIVTIEFLRVILQ